MQTDGKAFFVKDGRDEVQEVASCRGKYMFGWEM
jgi:arabinogalactan endo-1,4-beta-galactosidase